MGLDMYLYKKENQSLIEEEVAYWRKQYFLNTWFLKLPHNKEDDGVGYNYREVSKEALEFLLISIDFALKNPNFAPSIFPGADGYFSLGSEFKHTLKTTKDKIQKVLKETDFANVPEFRYETSW